MDGVCVGCGVLMIMMEAAVAAAAGGGDGGGAGIRPNAFQAWCWQGLQ